jgi:hypothetical protein
MPRISQSRRAGIHLVIGHFDNVHLQFSDDGLYSEGVLIKAQGFLPWGAESQSRFLPRKGLLALPVAGNEWRFRSRGCER